MMISSIEDTFRFEVIFSLQRIVHFPSLLVFGLSSFGLSATILPSSVTEI